MTRQDVYKEIFKIRMARVKRIWREYLLSKSKGTEPETSSRACPPQGASGNVFWHLRSVTDSSSAEFIDQSDMEDILDKVIKLFVQMFISSVPGTVEGKLELLPHTNSRVAI